MKKLSDNMLLGFFIGLAGPCITMLIFYFLNFPDQPLMEFLSFSVKDKLLSPLLSLCAVVNLGSFFLFINFDKYYTARGIILSTFVYGLAIVILKFA